MPCTHHSHTSSIHHTRISVTLAPSHFSEYTHPTQTHNFTTVRADRLHNARGGLITSIRDNIIFTTTDIPSTINTDNTELQSVKVHINNSKHITIANIYIPPRDSTSTHYNQLTRTYSYTDDYRGQLIADGISNSDHIALK